MRAWSFVVHAWNEASALRRLVESSLPMRDAIAEWVVLDHRSNDDTQAVLEDELRPLLTANGIRLTTLFERRDLSARCTFADVRTKTIKAASKQLVALQDADFILGPGYPPLLRRAEQQLSSVRSRYYGAAFPVPVVWDHLRIDARGVVLEHGRVWVHRTRPRLLVRDAVSYVQTKERGRWEKLVPDAKRPAAYRLAPGVRTCVPHAVLSVNVKPAERIELRDGMTMFMQDAVQGVLQGNWLENAAAGRVRSQGPYDYGQQPDLRGWRLHSTACELGTRQAQGAA